MMHGVQLHPAVKFHRLTPSASAVGAHQSLSLCICECVRAFFFVASYLHHDSAGNCSSAHTLKCLESYFKLDNVFEFSGFLHT